MSNDQPEMQMIAAWTYDPKKGIRFKGSPKPSGPCIGWRISCAASNRCEAYAAGSCVLTGMERECPHGKKVGIESSTRRRSKVYKDWETEQHTIEAQVRAEHTITSGRMPKRMLRIGDHYYLPYSFIPHPDDVQKKGVDHGCKWIAAKDMTQERLQNIFDYTPRSWLGDIITSYAKETLPSLALDIKLHFPELFDLLSEDIKEKYIPKSFVGKQVYLRSLAPCKVRFGTKDKPSFWDWDGTSLSRNETILFQPVPGACRQIITPERDAMVTIHDDAQVTGGVIFV